MHFNEMSVKSRQLGLTFVVAVLGVAILLVSRGSDFAFELAIGGKKFQLHVSVILFIGAFLAIESVKILDLHVYHKMLRGAVTFGEDFEENYMKQIFDLEKGMTQSISHFARFKDAKVEQKQPKRVFSYLGDISVTTEDKIRLFYTVVRCFTLGGAVVLLVATNFANWEKMNKPVVKESVPIQEQNNKQK